MSDQTQSQKQTLRTDEGHWLDDPRTPRRLWTALAVVLALLLVAELFVTHHHDGFMYSYGFHAWFGFLIGAVSILASKGWKKILKRKDTYYD